MLRRFLSLTRSLIVALSLFFLLAPAPAHAQATRWTESNGCVASVTYTNDVGGGTFEAATLQGVECLVQNILAVATTIIGLISFVMVIVGAFYYLTSGGNSSTIELGKKSITYGIIGIIVALLAYFILVLISDFTGVDRILQFNTQVGGN